MVPLRACWEPFLPGQEESATPPTASEDFAPPRPVTLPPVPTHLLPFDLAGLPQSVGLGYTLPRLCCGLSGRPILFCPPPLRLWPTQSAFRLLLCPLLHQLALCPPDPNSHLGRSSLQSSTSLHRHRLRPSGLVPPCPPSGIQCSSGCGLGFHHHDSAQGSCLALTSFSITLDFSVPPPSSQMSTSKATSKASSCILCLFRQPFATISSSSLPSFYGMRTRFVTPHGICLYFNL